MAVKAKADPTKDKITFEDVCGPVTTSWLEIRAAALRIQNFFSALNKLFVEREDLIRTLKYAFLMREHILFYGPPGSAKTYLADTTITNIEDAKYWNMDLSRFTTDTHLFGDFDVKEARESGRLLHITDHSILQAHYANLGELLDATTGLLRTLLRVLNEREFKRGGQELKVPLLTAIANTNIDPTKARETSRDLDAILDRFIFWYKVDYVQKPENRIEMLRRVKDGMPSNPLTKLALGDVMLVSGYILNMNLLSNEYILAAYEELARLFAKERNRPISDRRLFKGIQILDTSAVLRGSTEVGWQDLDRTDLVFVDAPAEQEIFQKILLDVKSRWQTVQTQESSNNETLAIDGLMQELPQFNPADATPAELVELKRSCLKLREKLVVLKTTNTSSSAHRLRSLEIIDQETLEVQKTIDTV